MPIKHGWRVWLCCEGREQSPGLLLGFHCVASSPAAPSSRFVCGGPNGAGSYKRTSLVFCTLLYECLALFSAPPRCQAAEYPLSDQFKANANTTPYYGRWRAFQWYCTGQGAGRRAGKGLRSDGMTGKQKGSLLLSGASGSERMEVCSGRSGVTRILKEFWRVGALLWLTFPMCNRTQHLSFKPSVMFKGPISHTLSDLHLPATYYTAYLAFLFFQTLLRWGVPTGWNKRNQPPGEVTKGGFQ